MRIFTNYIALSCLLIFLFSLSTTSFAADQNTLKTQLQTMLDRNIAASDTTPGAVLLISSNETGTITVASGYADINAKVKMQITNNFRIASITKTFVAVLMLKLAEAKAINLDSKIENILPNSIAIDRLPNGHNVTVRELLSMRSGIPNYLEYDAYSEKIEKEPHHDWVPEDGIQMIYDEKPNFKPNSNYEYSNTNYLLLQRIIEHITHHSLAYNLQHDIFDPLKMKQTFLEVKETSAAHPQGLTTHGYELEDDKLIDVTTINDGLGLGDGGIISTAQDLAIFVQHLLQSKTLLSPDSLKQMLTLKGEDAYGLGIYKEEVDDDWAYTHNGTSSGFVTQFYYFPERKLTLIVLTNSLDSDVIDTIAEQTLTILDQDDIALQKPFHHYSISYFLHHKLLKQSGN